MTDTTFNARESRHGQQQTAGAEIRKLARQVRIHALQMTSVGGSSHIGSILSCADILAVLYGEVMAIRPSEPKWSDRDRFILSKGHAGAGVYAVLAETGFFPVENLSQHYQNGSLLSGHVSHKGIPGVEVSTGSLGHGLGVGAGIAKALQLKSSASRVYVLLSDGECDEGSTWEAALFAQHHCLANLTAIVDYNKMQSLGSVQETLSLEPFVDKWRAFNWHVSEVDGHNVNALSEVIRTVDPRRPSVVIAHTTKGKGVSFMENTVLWHYRTAKGAELDAALLELERPDA